MTVTITQYKYAGKWGPFKITSACEECDLTTATIEDMMENEFKGKDVILRKKPWLDNWISCIFKGAWHAPIVIVDGKKFYQFSDENPLFDRKKLENLIKNKLSILGG
jgi:hypothetical protein